MRQQTKKKSSRHIVNSEIRESKESKRKASEQPDPFYKPVALEASKADQDQTFENKIEIMRYQLDIKK